MTTGEESLLECLRAFFLECPLLERGALFTCGRVDDLPPGYALRCARDDGALLRRYLDGGSRRRLLFDFCSRETFGCDTRRLRASMRFFDALAGWIAAQRGNLPVLPRGRTALLLEATGPARVEQTGEDSALWAMQCRLVYVEPAPGYKQNQN